METSALVESYSPDTSPRRVLLINPPVHDTRIPWRRWQQPVTLLQLATLLEQYKCDVRLLDALTPTSLSLPSRERIKVLARGSSTFNYWRFGASPKQMRAQLEHLRQEHWQPDEVYVEGFTTYWWPGVREVTDAVRVIFPDATIVLCGAYAQLGCDHARRMSGADVVVKGTMKGLAELPTHPTLYQTHLPFAYISFGSGDRSAEDVVEEIVSKYRHLSVNMRVHTFAFADHNVASRFREQFLAVLEAVPANNMRISLHVLGTLRARDIVACPEIANLLFRAGCKHIVFADDRDLPMTDEARENYLDDHRAAMALCVKAGFKPRQEQLSASLSVGRPGEDIASTTRFMSRLAHVAGSVIPIPYQPLPKQVADDPEFILHNGKLFPFAEQNGIDYRRYQDLLGLSALLNAKYREQTFDFLGDGLISQLVRKSLLTESWDPKRNGLPDRPIVVGYFNKEGKWVRS